MLKGRVPRTVPRHHSHIGGVSFWGMPDCQTCELVARRDAGDAPPWDRILRTASWDIVHAFGTAVEGWIVLVLRRHITTMADLTDEEARELGPLLREVSRALQATTGCAKTYVAQFAEDPRHPHVHVHVIPRPQDLEDEQRGPGIFSLLGVPEDRCVPEARMNQIAEDIGRSLTTTEIG
jgi:diadenosine tetraphosphate (Ap4A) HIT family hydrolase